MRFQLIEDAQAPWRSRVKSLESELQQATDAATSYKRDGEAMRERMETTLHEHRAAMREAELRHEMIESDLRAKLELRGGGAKASEPVDVERSRRVARENAELTVRGQKLLEEVEELRAENESLVNVRNHLLVAQVCGWRCGLQCDLTAEGMRSAHGGMRSHYGKTLARCDLKPARTRSHIERT